jgi:hypothetical protein
MRSRSFARSSVGLSVFGVNFFRCVNFFRFRMASPLRPSRSLHYALSSPLGVGVSPKKPIPRGAECLMCSP